MTRTQLVRAVAAGVALLSVPALASEWQVDTAHTTAQFTVKHMMISKVRGQFQNVTGTVMLDDKDATKSHVDVAIDAATIDTREAKRDAHLKSADFFDVQKCPKLTFKSTKIEKQGAGKYAVTGELTMHCQTHPLTLTVEAPDTVQKSPWGTQVRGVSATGKLSRKEWGLSWNKALEAGGVVVSDEVELQIDAELVGKPETTASSKPGK